MGWAFFTRKMQGFGPHTDLGLRLLIFVVAAWLAGILRWYTTWSG